jgi:hypothetical protein
MAKYMKISTVVEAFQAGTDGNYGILGTLVSTDWIIHMLNGDIHTMSNADFIVKYTSTSATAALSGTDWD